MALLQRTFSAVSGKQWLRKLLIENFEARRLLAGDTRLILDFGPSDDALPSVTVADFEQVFSESWWTADACFRPARVRYTERG